MPDTISSLAEQQHEPRLTRRAFSRPPIPATFLQSSDTSPTRKGKRSIDPVKTLEEPYRPLSIQCSGLVTPADFSDSQENPDSDLELYLPSTENNRAAEKDSLAATPPRKAGLGLGIGNESPSEFSTPVSFFSRFRRRSSASSSPLSAFRRRPSNPSFSLSKVAVAEHSRPALSRSGSASTLDSIASCTSELQTSIATLVHPTPQTEQSTLVVGASAAATPTAERSEQQLFRPKRKSSARKPLPFFSRLELQSLPASFEPAKALSTSEVDDVKEQPAEPEPPSNSLGLYLDPETPTSSVWLRVRQRSFSDTSVLLINAKGESAFLSGDGISSDDNDESSSSHSRVSGGPPQPSQRSRSRSGSLQLDYSFSRQSRLRRATKPKQGEMRLVFSGLRSGSSTAKKQLPTVSKGSALQSNSQPPEASPSMDDLGPSQDTSEPVEVLKTPEIDPSEERSAAMMQVLQSQPPRTSSLPLNVHRVPVPSLEDLDLEPASSGGSIGLRQRRAKPPISIALARSAPSTSVGENGLQSSRSKVSPSAEHRSLKSPPPCPPPTVPLPDLPTPVSSLPTPISSRSHMSASSSIDSPRSLASLPPTPRDEPFSASYRKRTFGRSSSHPDPAPASVHPAGRPGTHLQMTASVDSGTRVSTRTSPKDEQINLLLLNLQPNLVHISPPKNSASPPAKLAKQSSSATLHSADNEVVYGLAL
ncbi:hypothetical protein BCV70DRAFT_235008 [Testicularia cyperi]|uniref:Uncharacterized protein n=1 Tax=Testicularia cyperi TaxID=1882483 RepID=A0A317XYU8_9BASI|nr:hypothetical protein BCV70DRAFT_235008 [Testicularia cyperi]